MHQWLNRPGNGANADALRAFPGGPLVPRIFLGGEVDVIPEMSTEERNSGSLMYGNGQVYRWGGACTDVPDEIKTIDEWTTFNMLRVGLRPDRTGGRGGRYLLKDIQGLGDQWFARQHMVYLPTDGTRADAFVSSRTQLFGGRQRTAEGHPEPDPLEHAWWARGTRSWPTPWTPPAATASAGWGRTSCPTPTCSCGPPSTRRRSWACSCGTRTRRSGVEPRRPGIPATPRSREYGRWLGGQPRQRLPRPARRGVRLGQDVAVGHPPLADRRPVLAAPGHAPPGADGRWLRRPRRLELPARGPAGRPVGRGRHRHRQAAQPAVRRRSGRDTVPGRDGRSRPGARTRPR